MDEFRMSCHLQMSCAMSRFFIKSINIQCEILRKYLVQSVGVTGHFACFLFLRIVLHYLNHLYLFLIRLFAHIQELWSKLTEFDGVFNLDFLQKCRPSLYVKYWGHYKFSNLDYHITGT
jgi:hypothetical protein